MNTSDFTTRAVERASDLVNPILIKETRQSLKSRQFVFTFMLMLLASWAASVFGLVMAGDSIEYGSPGGQFFGVFYSVLAVAILIIVPIGAYRSLLAERDLNTFELLSITTLSPRQIIWGKLLNAMLQVFIFYSAIAPFIAFASLLQGFDLAQAAFVLAASLLVSLWFSMAAIMLGAISRTRQAQAVVSIGVFGGVIAGFSTVLGFAFDPFFVSFTDPDFWWATLFVTIGAASYFLLFQQIAVSQLTFESDNRSTGIRITCALQPALLWAVFLLFVLYQGALLGRDDVSPLVIVSSIHWVVVGFFVSTEDEWLSRRITRNLPRSKLLRIALAPLMPGGSRGYLYTLLNLGLLWLVAATLFEAIDASGSAWNISQGIRRLSMPLDWSKDTLAMSGICCYLIIYLGMGLAMGRWLHAVSSDLRAPHARVMLVLLIAAGIVIPYVPDVLEFTDAARYSILDITNPFATLDQIGTVRSSMPPLFILALLVAAAALVLLINFRALVRGVRDISGAEVKERTPAHESHFVPSLQDRAAKPEADLTAIDV